MEQTSVNSPNTLIVSSLYQMLDGYQSSLEAMNRSPKTISWYLDILKRYFGFLMASHSSSQIDQLGRKELRSYIVKLQNTKKWPNNPNIAEDHKGKLSAYSIQGHVRAIKAFWGWLLKEGYTDKNPLANFPLPKVPSTVIKTLTKEQILELFSNIDKSSLTGMRDYCILLLLIDSGIRVSELAGIKISDIDFPHNLIMITGKGQKQRVVPITRHTKKHLNQYLRNSRPLLCKSGTPYLFPSRDGEHISVNGIQQFLRRLAKKSGLGNVKCSPHIFRHSFATHALANGANVLVLKDIMGHESLATTNKYTHLRPGDIQKQHARFSPVAELFKGKA